MKKGNLFHQLQTLGQSLMVPVSVLPGAGLVVALGRFLQLSSSESTLKVAATATEATQALTPHSWLYSLGSLLYHSGLAIFEQLPVIFAIGVAIGFSGGAGVAGLSAAAAYFTVVNLLKATSEIQGLALSINTGVFGGIIVGLLAAYLYKRFHETRLHPVLGFFSGKRLIPLLTVFFSLFIGLVLSFIWPPIQSAINEFGAFITNSSLGPAFYAAGKRLLIPVGLHHVYYPSFLFEFGEYVSATGEILRGDSPRYFAGDPKAGLFMASEFPIMLFGLPAAALAMVLRSSSHKRKAVMGVMLSAALTSMITGITEPIEFSFIFVAPLLFGIHVVLAFVAGLLTHWVDLHLGYTFSASLIDFVVGYYNQKNALQLWIFVGPLIGVLYFTSFYFLIPLFNYKTPGREEDEASELMDSLPTEATAHSNLSNKTSSVSNLKSDLKIRTMKILEALGGAENIQALDACITRLRLKVKDLNSVQEGKLKNLGASGIMKASGGSLQVVFGTESDSIKEAIKKLMQEKSQPSSEKSALREMEPNPAEQLQSLSPLPRTKSEATTHGETKSYKDGALTFELLCPLEGKLLSLASIPDETFSQGLMGPGVGIDPTGDQVVAPFDGTVVTLFHTHHALGLESEDLLQGHPIELLIHVGIDTVKMQGQGFEAFVKQGDKVKKGQILLKFDRARIQKEASSVITPVIITNIDQFKSFKPENSQFVPLLKKMGQLK